MTFAADLKRREVVKMSENALSPPTKPVPDRKVFLAR